MRTQSENAERLRGSCVETWAYLVEVVPGVVFESSGAEGFSRPSAFSGVLEWTAVGPGPAVAGLSPLWPEGSTAWATSGAWGWGVAELMPLGLSFTSLFSLRVSLLGLLMPM